MAALSSRAQEPVLSTGIKMTIRSVLMNRSRTSTLTRLQVVANGSLRAQFNQTGKIDLLEHSVSEFKEYVPLKTMQMESPEQKSSPNVTKSGKKAAATGQRNSKIPVIPRSVVGEWGLSDLVVQLLEV